MKKNWVNKEFLLPGKQYTFKYAIHFREPSSSDAPATAEIAGEAVNFADTVAFFAVSPKHQTSEPDHYRLKSTEIIYGAAGANLGAFLASEIRKVCQMELAIQGLKSDLPSRGILVGTSFPSLPKTASLPPEGFEILVSTGRIIIQGADDRGCLYSIYALLGRLRNEEGKWVVSCGMVRDWPDLPVRGICMELLPPAIRDLTLFKRYLDAFSRARANLVIFYHNPRQILAWQKGVDDGGWTRDQMVEIAEYARSLQMEVWGGMLAKFDAVTFPELNIAKGTRLYNPFKMTSYDVLFSLYDEILSTYSPSVFLIGHDEIKGLSLYAAQHNKSTAEILAKDIKKIHDMLASRGVATAMWGDMLLDSRTWASKVGNAHSRDRLFNSGATHLAVDMIPKDIHIVDWHYREKPRYPSIQYFREKGFQAIGCTWHDPKAAKAMAESVKEYDGQGIIASDWGFWRTLSPAATTLYAPLCGWPTDCSIGEGDVDITALATVLSDSSGKGAVFCRRLKLSLFGRLCP